jgi:uncharacterized membrane protein YebE (DUF533 family)
MSSLNDSQFNMWRTIFAFSNADGVISEEEVIYLAKVLELVPFSEAQRNLLKSELREPPDITETFAKISDQDDRATFFHYARMLAWCDGDYASQEQELMTKLQRLQIESVDFEEMIETVRFSFDNEEQKNLALKEYQELTEKGREGVLKALASKFTG